MFTATMETTKGLVKYPFHLGTVEWIARDCAKELMHRKWTHQLGKFDVRTVGLWQDGKLVDVFDGSWTSDFEHFLDECYS